MDAHRIRADAPDRTINMPQKQFVHDLGLTLILTLP